MNPEQELQETEQEIVDLYAPTTDEAHVRELLARHASAAVALTGLAKSLTPQASPITEVVLTFPSTSAALRVRRQYTRAGSDVKLLMGKNTVTISGENRDAVLYAAAFIKEREGGTVLSSTPAVPAESPKSLTPPAFRATVSLRDASEMPFMRAYFSGGSPVRLLASSEGFQLWGETAADVEGALGEVLARWNVTYVYLEWNDYHWRSELLDGPFCPPGFSPPAAVSE